MKYLSNNHKNIRQAGSYENRGMSLIEVIVGAAIIGTAMVAIVGIFGGLSKLSYRNTARIQSAMIAEEGIEALKTMRDAGWTSNIASLIANNGINYRLYWNGSVWTATSSPSIRVDTIFDRTFTLYSVYRDASFNVVSSGGTLDSDSRRAVVTVSWRDDGATSSKILEDYIFNSFNN